MAQIDWHQKGHDYAYSWEPGNKLPEFPDDTAKQQFTDGYKDELREIWVGRSKSNSLIAEAVHETLPRQYKNCTFQLVVHGNRVLGYRYTV